MRGGTVFIYENSTFLRISQSDCNVEQCELFRTKTNVKKIRVKRTNACTSSMSHRVVVSVNHNNSWTTTNGKSWDLSKNTRRFVSVQDFGINRTLSDRLEGMSADLLSPAQSATKAEVCSVNK